MTSSKTFFIATDLDNSNIVMGYGATYDAAQKDAERTAREVSVQIGDLDINEVFFDEGGDLARVDGASASGAWATTTPSDSRRMCAARA